MDKSPLFIGLNAYFPGAIVEVCYLKFPRNSSSDYAQQNLENLGSGPEMRISIFSITPTELE